MPAGSRSGLPVAVANWESRGLLLPSSPVDKPYLVAAEKPATHERVKRMSRRSGESIEKPRDAGPLA